MSRLDVICIGSATLDTIVVVPEYPDEDGRVEATDVVTAGGGPAATAAVTLSRLGLSAGFAGTVADDAAGAEIRRGLEAEGVDTRWLTTAGPHSGASVVVVSGAGSRTIFTRPAPSRLGTALPADAAVWMHVDQTGYAAGRGGRSPQMRLSVDAGNPIPGLSLTGVDVYAPTVQALHAAFPGRTPEAIREAHTAGARAVVATDGSRGAHYSVGHEAGTVAAFDVDVTSTLGAGDVFHGALLAGLVRGADLRTATELASWVAGMSCRGLDGRSAIPQWGEVLTKFPSLNTL